MKKRKNKKNKKIVIISSLIVALVAGSTLFTQTEMFQGYFKRFVIQPKEVSPVDAEILSTYSVPKKDIKINDIQTNKKADLALEQKKADDTEALKSYIAPQAKDTISIVDSGLIEKTENTTTINEATDWVDETACTMSEYNWHENAIHPDWHSLESIYPAIKQWYNNESYSNCKMNVIFIETSSNSSPEQRFTCSNDVNSNITLIEEGNHYYPEGAFTCKNSYNNGETQVQIIIYPESGFRLIHNKYINGEVAYTDSQEDYNRVYIYLFE